MFFAALPFLKKAATEAFNSTAGFQQHSDQSESERSGSDNHRSAGKRSDASNPSRVAYASGRSKNSGAAEAAVGGSDYPGDYHGTVNFEYSPSADGDADPGEIVWTWVPFEEDYSQGKDRPVVLVGRDGNYLLALMMTSKDHNNREHSDRDYLDIGAGPWDAKGRPSEVKLDRVIRVRPESMRREGAIMPRTTFDMIVNAYTRR